MEKVERDTREGLMIRQNRIKKALSQGQAYITTTDCTKRISLHFFTVRTS